jgi:hypothetical protein
LYLQKKTKLTPRRGKRRLEIEIVAGVREMEPRGACRRRSGAVLLFVAAFLAAALSASASSIGDKCAACKAVAVSSSLLPSFSLSQFLFFAALSQFLLVACKVPCLVFTNPRKVIVRYSGSL